MFAHHLTVTMERSQADTSCAPRAVGGEGGEGRGKGGEGERE